MIFEIEVGARTFAAAVERVKGETRQFRITIDGQSHLVDAVRLGDGALSLLLPPDSAISTGGTSHHVTISEEPSTGELSLGFPGATVQATVNGRRVRHAGDSAGAAGEQRVTAPMPGRVLRVLVTPGAEVAARQPLVVVEAMKMENELSSPKAGHVKEVLVTEGQSVEAGRLLVIVE